MAERLRVTHFIFFLPAGLPPHPAQTHANRETAMAATRKSAGPKTTALKRRAKKGLKAARGGLDSVLQAGKKTWETLKTTTANVIG